MSAQQETYGAGAAHGRGEQPSHAVLAAVLLAGAGLLHMAVVRAHLAEGVVDPVLFTATSWGQLLVAGWLLLRVPGRGVWLAVLAVAVLPGAAWAVSRTSGLPWGHTAGAAEDVRVIGAVTTTLEAAVAVLAVVVGLLGAGRSSASRVRALVPAAVVAGALVVVGTSSAVLAAPLGHHGGGGGSAEQHGGGVEGAGHGHGDEQPSPTTTTSEPTATPSGSHGHAGDHDHPSALPDEPSASASATATATAGDGHGDHEH